MTATYRDFHIRHQVTFVNTNTLRIAYIEIGPIDGWPVLLFHGFPCDVQAFDDVAKVQARFGAKVIAPFTRGYTRSATNNQFSICLYLSVLLNK